MNVRPKKTLGHILFSAALIFASAPCANAQSTSRDAETPLTNASVVKLVRAGFSEKTVIAIVRSRPARFDLSPDRLIELKKSGVSEKVILAMLAHGEEVALSEDDLDFSDPFFKDGKEGREGAQGAGRQSDPDEVNIFGSSGSSRGRTRTRGQNGGSEGDSEVTGSATVRILRPPVEAGGAGAPKLEKTPTLTNDSIVELVEAGFSEGTIIRRIEQSPAAFDLSQPKLEDLRRRRVTEPVIAAMRAAMSEDGAPASNPEK
ncbi:MAG TPA: hypothetical protein VER32_03725 [Pyrinomonadaceae bacterium]|nr:hypothetical protein [Pyrinomonadaceae bacterium]